MTAHGMPEFMLLAGRRCLITRWDPPDGGLRASLLVAQGFGDEANLCRRMIRLLAQALQPKGIRTVVVDFSGTGDSAGMLSDASLDCWMEEFAAIHVAIRDRSFEPDEVAGAGRHRTEGPPWAQPPVFALGIRFGAWLALSRLSSHEPDFAGLILWAPVLRGTDQLRERDRLLLASARVARGSPPDAAERGDRSEVHRDGLAPGARLLAQLSMSEAPAPRGGQRLALFDLRNLGGDEPVQPTRRSLDAALQWQDAGSETDIRALASAPFWNVSDPVDCPALIDATVGCLDRWS